MSKIDRMVREFLTSHTEEQEIPSDIQKNPLVGYLKLFRNQHKVISILYKGLITAFAGFVLLLSLMILNVLQNNLVPAWGAILLALTDLFLLFGVYKAFRELHRYREKSIRITDQIYAYLKKDLEKLGKIQLERGFLREAHNRQKSNSSHAEDAYAIPVKGKDHQGWDSKICSHCGATIEMLAETCPVCRQGQGKYLAN